MMYRTITIKKHLSNTNEWSEHINVGFQADEVILLNVQRYDDDLDANRVPNGDFITVLKTDLINNQILCTIPKSVSYEHSGNTPFKLDNKNVDGNYTFRVLNIDENVPINVNTMDMYISITLLFKKNNI